MVRLKAKVTLNISIREWAMRHGAAAFWFPRKLRTIIQGEGKGECICFFDRVSPRLFAERRLEVMPFGKRKTTGAFSVKKPKHRAQSLREARETFGALCLR